LDLPAAYEFCQQHQIDPTGVADLVTTTNRIKLIDQGSGLSEEEQSWQFRIAFKLRESLAFSKKELGVCNIGEYEVTLRDPN
jgi:hypothetical protein